MIQLMGNFADGPCAPEASAFITPAPTSSSPPPPPALQGNWVPRAAAWGWAEQAAWLRRSGLALLLLLLRPVRLLLTPGLWPARLLCPCDCLGKNTGVGCHFLLQGILPTQGSNPGLLHQQVGSLPSEPPGEPTSGLGESRTPQAQTWEKEQQRPRSHPPPCSVHSVTLLL